MNNKSFTHYLTLISTIFILILVSLNLFRTSSNLKESKQKIDSVLEEIKAANTIITEQSNAISELQKLNNELNKKVLKIDSTNYLIKKNIDANFNNANTNLANIKKSIEDIKKLEGPK